MTKEKYLEISKFERKRIKFLYNYRYILGIARVSRVIGLDY